VIFGRPPDIVRLTAKGDLRGLLKALGYPGDAVIRTDAAEALGRLGDPQAVEPLLAALGNEHEIAVRRALVVALGDLQDPRAVDALADLARDDYYFYGEAAFRALVAIGPPSFDALVAALGDGGADVRAAAATSLGAIGDHRAVEPLLATLRDSKASTRQGAAEALDRLGWVPGGDEDGAAYWIAKRRWDKCVRATAIGPLVAVLADEDATIAERAGRVLVRIGARAVPSLIDGLDSSSADVLARIGAPAVAALLTQLGNDDDTVRVAAATALGQIADAPAAVDPLITALGDPAPDVRRAAVLALGRICDPSTIDAHVIEPVVGLLADEHSSVGRSAAAALDALGWSPREPAQAIDYWIATGQWERCTDRAAVEPLLAVVSPDRGYVEEGAVAALGRLGDPRAVEPLIAILRDSDVPIDSARAAARALVALYQSGKLTAAQQARVLTQRDAITYSEPERDSLRFGSRPGEDRSIEVSFPL
jgi:HEAT repeat protein